MTTWVTETKNSFSKRLFARAQQPKTNFRSANASLKEENLPIAGTSCGSRCISADFQRPYFFLRKIVTQPFNCIYLQPDDCIIMETRRDIFQAIADPTRRAILSLIAVHALTPNALAEHFDTSRQAVSKHLQILSECDLLKQHQTGREIYYSLNSKKMKEVSDWIEQFRELWEGRMNRIDALLKSKNKA
jgi:DNA-binding transcriptional ArsR family regulator